MDNLHFATIWKGGVPGARQTVRLAVLQLEGCAFDGARLTESARDSPSVSSVPPVSVAWIPKVRCPKLSDGKEGGSCGFC